MDSKGLLFENVLRGHVMRLNFYEADCLCKIEDFKDICNLYCEIITLGIQAKERQIKEEYCAFNEADLEEKYSKLHLFKYRMDLLLLCCISEVWEQDLYVFLKEALKSKEDFVKEKIYSEHFKTSSSSNDIESLISSLSNNDYNTVKQIYKDIFDIDIDEFPLINEMRDFANAIKHGLGYSLKRLKNKLGEKLFLNRSICSIDENGKIGFIKGIDVIHTTLNSETLDTEGKLQEYTNAVEKFWLYINKKINLGDCEK